MVLYADKITNLELVRGSCRCNDLCLLRQLFSLQEHEYI